LALLNIQIDPCESAIPRLVAKTIADAWETIQAFQTQTRNNPVKGFHPSDFEGAYQWLVGLKKQFSQNAIPRFCEWGSGFGVTSYLAQSLGYEATAIESDPKLFQAAQRWQNRIGASFTHLNGSFIPPSFLEKHQSITAFNPTPTLWLNLNVESRSESNRLDSHEFDLVYAYPWPGEEEFIFELFDVVSKPGALLLTFHGAADFRLHQKTTAKPFS
jgi:hypothetical protein